jgi:hypothetical protein
LLLVGSRNGVVKRAKVLYKGKAEVSEMTKIKEDDLVTVAQPWQELAGTDLAVFVPKIN